ncbi:hypothetical protein [Acinetobacter equi]|uniref:Lipoprotein n=1 Tax=Acinetobacter equi TaxID=1324350 RepID=A0A0N9VC21_9GAMM|nr:hypothetical protein [Acinetobacter equi]ALH94631.1 hypothetical protein AOY20_03270 [Acinetobacter equi]
MKLTQKIYICFLSLILSGCYTTQFLTEPNYPTEAALVANAYENGLSADIDISYEQAFNHLKQAYQQCVAFTTEEDLVYSDNRLEEHLEMGTIFIKVYPNQFLQKTLVEGLTDHKTRITLFLPRAYPYAQSRFKRDLIRALGQDPECNIGVVVPVKN